MKTLNKLFSYLMILSSVLMLSCKDNDDMVPDEGEENNVPIGKWSRVSDFDGVPRSGASSFTIGNKGLAVIQQRFSADTKSTYWTEVDSWLTDSLYLHPKFKEYFDSRSGECTDGLYPTVTIRQIMWALKMKPIQRQRWETCFDRREI